MSLGKALYPLLSTGTRKSRLDITEELLTWAHGIKSNKQTMIESRERSIESRYTMTELLLTGSYNQNLTHIDTNHSYYFTVLFHM